MSTSQLHRLLLTVTLVLASVDGRCTAEEPPAWDPWDHAEICTQSGRQARLTLGHVRLVLEDRFYGRRTPYGDEQIPSLRGTDQTVRNRKCRAFMNALPPMLRIPLARRESWGLAMRGKRPDLQRHPDGTEYWPFQCTPLPLSEPQLRLLTATFEEHFEESDPARKDEQLDHHFDYRKDNCTTWIGQKVVAALEAEPSGQVWEAALLEIMDRATRPTQLRRQLDRWLAQVSAGGDAPPRKTDEDS